jgi:hypothetical protein
MFKEERNYNKFKWKDLGDIKTGILPICACCKKIKLERTDSKNQDHWMQIESYIIQKTNAKLSHSICTECMKKLYPNFIDEDE